MMYTLPYQKIIDYSFDKKIDKDKIQFVTKDLPIFISSRLSGLEAERELIAKKLSEVGFPVIGWETGETFGVAQTSKPRDTYLHNLKKAVVYLGIIDDIYGNINPDIGISATEDEYNNSIKENKEIILFVSNNPKDSEAEKLVERWKKLHTITFYNDISDLEKKIDEVINGLLLRYSENWIMLGDLIFNSPYKIINNEIIINKITTNREVIAYFNSFVKGKELSFIDLSVGEVIYTEFISIEITKNYAKIFEYKITINQLSRIERMSWNEFQVYIDFDINDITNSVSGEPLLKQTVHFSMMVNRGGFLYSSTGSNLYNICHTYYNNIPLATILIKFDIIEVLLSKCEPEENEKITPRIPCLERAEVLNVYDIKENGFKCKIKLDIENADTFIYDYDCYWNDNDEE
jgi:hypothetical protein